MRSSPRLPIPRPHVGARNRERPANLRRTLLALPSQIPERRKRTMTKHTPLTAFRHATNLARTHLASTHHLRYNSATTQAPHPRRSRLPQVALIAVSALHQFERGRPATSRAGDRNVTHRMGDGMHMPLNQALAQTRCPIRERKRAPGREIGRSFQRNDMDTSRRMRRHLNPHPKKEGR